MVKVRLHGTEEEVKEILYAIQEDTSIQVLSISDPYKDKNSVYVRVYVDLQKIRGLENAVTVL